MDKLSYALGLGIGRQLSQMGAEDLNIDDFAQAIKDIIAGNDLQVTDQEAQSIVTEFFQQQEAKQRAAAAEKYKDNKDKGEAWLAEKAMEEGVVTLPSGLMYQVLNEGTGKKPTAADTVECHYEGRLIDGTVFDSSYKRGESATFPLNGVIAGWTEGVQLMSEGAKYRFFIPYTLGYGERGTHDAAAVTIKQILEDAHKNVKDAGTLDKLSADVNTLLAKDHPDVKAEDLIVSDLFDVSYVENGAVAPLNQKVTITFKLTVPVENVLLVLHKTSSGDWELMNMDSSKYQKLDKYQVKLTFDSLSPVVFAIDSAEFHVDPNGPSSPQTGEISPVVVIAGMTIVAACAAAYVVRKEKAAR